MYKLIFYIMKGFLNKDLSTSSLMSQVPVEGHNVTHATDTTHITYAFSNFQRDRSTNDVTLRRDNCTLPPVSRLPAEGCWEKIRMWQATSLLIDVNSISLQSREIFVKIHTRVAIHIRYIWYKFHCAISIITGMNTSKRFLRSIRRNFHENPYLWHHTVSLGRLR
jgi:hypothetical protein